MIWSCGNARGSFRLNIFKTAFQKIDEICHILFLQVSLGLYHLNNKDLIWHFVFSVLVVCLILPVLVQHISSLVDYPIHQLSMNRDYYHDSNSHHRINLDYSFCYHCIGMVYCLERIHLHFPKVDH